MVSAGASESTRELAQVSAQEKANEVFDYRLGNRSALDWVIDQYQISTDKRSGITSDPNNPDDEEYIVRLVGQVVPVVSLPNSRVRIETVKIVNSLPAEYAPPSAGRKLIALALLRVSAPLRETSSATLNTND